MTTAAEHVIEIGDSSATVSGLTADEGAALAEEIDRPSHLARCRECGAKVTYRPTSSGAGFTIIKHSQPDPETTFGVSASGLPMCPDGHGEMEIADDQIPVADAFEDVSEQLAGEAFQRSLPGIVPEFNWKGAYLELESMAVEVDALHAQAKEDAETARESKKHWEKRAETFQKMGLEFRRRRREKGDGRVEGAYLTPDVQSTDRCRFEELSPGVPCPICTDADLRVASTVLPGSEEHGVEAKDLLERREIDVCVVELAAMGVIVPAETLGALPIDQLSEVQAWSKDGMQNPERREELLESLPKGLGRPCVVGDVVTSEAEPGDTFLSCERCDGRVASKPTGSSEDLPIWPAGTLYGTNCPGKDPGHRYPSNGKKKNTRKAKA